MNKKRKKNLSKTPRIMRQNRPWTCQKCTYSKKLTFVDTFCKYNISPFQRLGSKHVYYAIFISLYILMYYHYNKLIQKEKLFYKHHLLLTEASQRWCGKKHIHTYRIRHELTVEMKFY